MIHVRATVADGLTSITVEGHENLVEHHAEQGRVCAAVTAVTRTALLGLEQIALRHPQHVSIEIQEDHP